jgi:translocator protein
MDFQTYYQQLSKPTWTPSTETIGLVWSLLYPVIFGVVGYVVYKLSKQQVPTIVALPFLLNLVFNFSFTPVQFGLRNQFLALVVIAGIWLTIVWSIVAAWSFNKWITLAYVPYLIWVSVASALQYSIWSMNR